MANSRNSAPRDPVLRTVHQFLFHHLGTTTAARRIVVGLSGGRDSVALLHMLWLLRDDFALSLRACHVHHGLSTHADEWQAYCVELCAQLEIPLVVAQVQVPQQSKSGLEAAARALRYQVYAQQQADWIALAHHQGDQAETLLFNLLRGCGVRGAAGIPQSRRLNDRQCILRPLLSVSRAQITDYLQRQGLGWVEDESNLDTRYSRNFLRTDILSRIERRFPAASSRLAMAAENFAVANRLLDDLACLDLAAAATEAAEPGSRAGHVDGEAFDPRLPRNIPLSLLRNLSTERALNVLRYFLQQHGVRIPSAVRMQEALQQFLAAAADRHPRVSFGEHQLRRRRQVVELVEALENSPGSASETSLNTLK